ncbi:MAG TPA: hypothetical protein VGK45_14300, partial [Thermoanaerobaculia bacterium]
PEPEVILERRAAIDTIRADVQRIETLERLNENNLVRRFRDLKHDLGTFFFEPDLLLAIQETNLALKNRIHKLYRQEEQRIVAEYQRIFELEREVPVDRELDSELTEFRKDIERFERKLQSQEFKLEDIAQIRMRVKNLLPRLTASRPELGAKEKKADATSTGEFILVSSKKAAETILAFNEDLLGESYRKVLDALRETNPEVQPERVVLVPEIFPLRLEPREVVAYRRLYGRKAHDEEIERFILEAASLRVRINEEAQEITSILDETSITGDSPIYARARLTTRLADAYLWRFSHVTSQSLLGNDPGENRQLEILRMRLMRDYSGLWLLVYKPFFGRRPGGTLA